MAGSLVVLPSDDNGSAKPPPPNSDALPDSTDPSGPCPRCSRTSNFALIGHLPLTYAHPGAPNQALLQRITSLQCYGCKQNLLVIEEAPGGVVQWRGVFWWPSPGMHTNDSDVPQRVGDAVAEAVRCLAVAAPRAAAVMFRGAVAEIVTDRGSDEAKRKHNLAQQLRQMATEHSLDAALADWADHIRVLGNAGAHPNELEPVTMDEAEDLGRLAASLLEYLYVVPARVRRRREGR